MSQYQKKNYFFWHYGDGVRDYLSLWKRFLDLIWRFFSIGLLTRTLFSTWHRDVSLRNWRGFDPLKWATSFLENTFSRVIGAIVRIFVIAIGFAFYALLMIAGLVFLMIYLLAPIVLIVGVSLLFVESFLLLGSAIILLCLLILVISWRTYYFGRRMPYEYMSMQQLHAQRWFARVYRRIGVDPQNIPELLLSRIDLFEEFLHKRDVSTDEFENVVAWEMHRQQERENNGKWWSEENLLKVRPIGQHWHYGYTVTIDRFSIDLTQFDPTEYRNAQLVDHVSEMDLMELVLHRPQQNSVALIGPPGIGKNTLVHALAERIREGQYDGTYLADKRILNLNLGEAISAASNSGADVDLFLRRIFHEAAYAGNVILVLENFEQYFSGGQTAIHTTIAGILDEYLPLPTFHIIGLSTTTQFHRVIERLPGLMKNIEVVEVHETSQEETGRIIYDRFVDLEKNERIIFTYQAVRQILRDADQYNNHAPLPERAIDLAMEVLLHWQKEGTTPYITREIVDDYISKKTGIAVGTIDKEERERLLNLEDILHHRIIGQEEAIRQCAEAVRRMRTGLGDQDKPVSSFLFLGPTGVGKTETAKALAQAYFGDEDKMVRLDMSEYQGPTALGRLIGSEQLGHSGYLTTAAKDHPNAVLLLDEIEKAEPRVLDVFLQILDEGYVTDGMGKKINMRNMIIIATSNAGALLIKKLISEGLSVADAKKQIIDEITNARIFRVEFLNRFDNIILFRPLSLEELTSVVRLMLAQTAERLAQEKNLTVSFGEALIPHIIEHGYDPIFGARSINRYIADKIEDALATKLISGDVMRGEDIHIVVADITD